MKIKRLIVNTGIKVSDFFAEDLQNIHYKSLFLANAKKYIGDKHFDIDREYEIKSKEYWKSHTGLTVNPIWHNYYSSRNGIKDVRYVPENIYYAYIEPFYNRKGFSKCCDDKCYYSERFPYTASTVKFKRSQILLRNISGMFFDEEYKIMSFEEAARLLSECKTGYVIKESITGRGGNRITFVDKGVRESYDNICSLFKRYKKDFVVEEIIDQCKELKRLNPSSINTIRLITFMDEKGVHTLSSVLRIGGKDAKMDNFSTGGIACGINSDGSLKEDGYDQMYNKYTKIHPNGICFANETIPEYKNAKTLVEDLHRRFGHFRIISWDIAIGEDYIPIIIEFNLTPQGIDLHQINNGPLFGELTERVLWEVFQTKQ